MLKLYADASFTNPIRTRIGFLVGDGSDSTMDTDGAPSHVRIFSSEFSWGNLLASPADYTYADNVVTLKEAPAIGETIVAMSEGEYVFEDLHAVGNDSLEANRTMEQRLFVRSEDANASDVKISIDNILSSSVIDELDHFLAEDNSGTPGTYGEAGAPIELGDLASGESTSFFVKCIVPEGTPMDNYHNILIKASSENFSTHE